MEHNRIGRRSAFLRLGLAAFLSAGGGVGIWMALARGGMAAWVTAAVLAIAAALGTVWQFHARAVRRLQATWDAYARLEIARTKSRKTGSTNWITSTRKDVLRNHRVS